MQQETTPRFFQDYAPVFARLGIWNRKFGPVLSRLAGAQLQKISASDEGFMTLNFYKPGEDRSLVVFSIRKGESGIMLSDFRPPSQPKPNSIVAMGRKYFIGRRVKYAYASLDPVALLIEFDNAPDEKDPELLAGPNCILLDLDSKPARICLSRRMSTVPQRYDHVEAPFRGASDFFESFCEWSLDATKTKRRATFEAPLLTYSIIPATFEEKRDDAASKALNKVTEKQKLDQEAGPQPMTLERALTLLPPHVRRPTKTRLQFLERRIGNQKNDLPNENDLERLTKRAEGLRANLYMWPADSNIWYVPRELIEEFGLPAFIKLKQGERPGDILDDLFLESDKLKRRRDELKVRVAQSELAFSNFKDLILAAGSGIEEAFDQFRRESKNNEPLVKQDWSVLLGKISPDPALQLCRTLDIAWGEGEQKRQVAKENDGERLPYRKFVASTGEFIRVGKSASDSDDMLRLMPGHHMWLHVLAGEGSHIWLEKPKGHTPSPQAVRESAILAVHYSKLGRGHSGEVRVAKRSDIEKKKDLAPGKVIVRRCDTILVRYEEPELQTILASSP